MWRRAAAVASSSLLGASTAASSRRPVAAAAAAAATQRPAAALAQAAACGGCALALGVGAASSGAGSATRAEEQSAAQGAAPGRCFADAVVVITGGGGNLGLAGAKYFRRAGAHVVLLDAAECPLRSAEAELKALPGTGRCLARVCDITNDADVEAAVKAAEDAFGKITHLWNNAGYQGAILMTENYPVDDFQRVQDINVVGAFRVLKAVAASMQRAGEGGVIVNTASVAGLRGTPAMPAYVASKAAVIGLTMSVAKDLAPHGIRVNAISPALIGPGYMWDRQNELHAASGSPYFARDAEAVARAKVSGVPMKRVGSIEEVVASVAFLMSEDSSYCTGTNLIVDGGLAMR